MKNFNKFIQSKETKETQKQWLFKGNKNKNAVIKSELFMMSVDWLIFFLLIQIFLFSIKIKQNKTQIFFLNLAFKFFSQSETVEIAYKFFYIFS